LEDVNEDAYLEVEEMMPRDCEYSDGRILIWELKSGAHDGSAIKFTNSIMYKAMVGVLTQQNVANPIDVVDSYVSSSGGRRIPYTGSQGYSPDASITPNLNHIGTATVVVETASSESNPHVLAKVPDYLGENSRSTDVQAVIIFSLELPPDPPHANKRPAMIALQYQRRSWETKRANGVSINDCLCQPDYAIDFSSGANGFVYPSIGLQAIVGDTAGVSLFNSFPNPRPPPCQTQLTPSFMMPIALDDIFFIRTGGPAGVGARQIPQVFGGQTHIHVDLFDIQTVVHRFYNPNVNNYT
jgi:hypothetical protein